MSSGRSLELFFVDGKADGMLTAEVFNWTGHVLMVPRIQISAALKRPEARHTGVYVLFGQKDGTETVYVGEAENVAKRIRDHDASKGWWSRVAIVTTTSDALHKAHVKYWESRLVEMARSVGEVPLENGNIPPRSSLSESAQANMEDFLQTLSMVFPALGITLFESRKRPEISTEERRDADMDETFLLETPRNGVKARAKRDGSDFIMLKGSLVRSRWEGKGEHDFGYRVLHEKLVQTGVIATSTDPAVLLENFAFNSPSAAAAVANDRPANGRVEWKIEVDGRTLAEWETDQLSDVGLEAP